MILDNSNSN